MISQKSDISLDPRGDIEFDEYERNGYVSRFLEVFKADITEKEMCMRAYEIHLELRTRHDLYIAVCSNLEPVHRRALHTYAACRGNLEQAE